MKIADRAWCIIQGRQQVFLDIADVGGVLPHTVHDILHMGAVKLQIIFPRKSTSASK